jgi:gluconokinase
VTTVVVAGVSGSGKTRVGAALAERLGWEFVDADDHHPPGNIDKMSAGVPLTDADRAPWLARLNALIRERERQGDDLVLACSALKRAYRARLRDGVDDVLVVHLHVSPELVAARLHARRGHFLPPDLLASQFADLEPPEGDEALVVDADRPVDVVVDHIAATVEGHPTAGSPRSVSRLPDSGDARGGDRGAHRRHR